MWNRFSPPLYKHIHLTRTPFYISPAKHFYFFKNHYPIPFSKKCGTLFRTKEYSVLRCSIVCQPTKQLILDDGFYHDRVIFSPAILIVPFPIFLHNNFVRGVGWNKKKHRGLFQNADVRERDFLPN